MPQKVIHFISSLGRAGRERQLGCIYKYHNPARQDVKIVYLNHTEPNCIEDFSMQPQDLIKIKAKNVFGRLFELQKILRQENPDAVFAWGFIEAFFSLVLKPFNNYAFINGSIQHGIISLRPSHYLRMVLLHFSGNIVANSYAGLAANHLKRGQVLYNGIEEKFFNVQAKTAQILRLKEKNKPPFLISVANLLPYKDYFTVLEALAVIKEKGYGFSYFILGDGPMREQIAAKIKKLGLSREVLLFGSKSNVEDYMSISDIFIHSSKGEGCSNAILEAMACGLAVIATATGGTPEVVDKNSGLLFRYRDKNGLVNCLELLLNDTQKVKEFGRQAKEKAIKMFSMNSMLERYCGIIEAATKKD